MIRLYDIEVLIQLVGSNNRWLAATLARAALEADLCSQAMMDLAVSIDAATLQPGLLDLAGVCPRMEPAEMSPEDTAH